VSIVFLGTSDFSATVLEHLAASGEHRPALVVTRPDRRQGRGQKLAPPPVAEAARELGLALAQPANVNEPEARAQIAAAGENGRQTVVVCAFGALIREPLLSEHEMLNVHPSLLPRWRGAAPIERAIMAGDEQTGVSIMRLTAGLDSGPVALTGSEPIAAEDTYGTLARRLEPLAAELLLRVLDERPEFREQPDEGVTYAEKITASDRLLDPQRPAAELERVVRALQPHIGARAELADGSLLGVQRAALVAGADSGAGRGVVADDGRLLLLTADGALELLEVQPPGGRPMEAGAYLRGRTLPGRR
jgi:methionyl-tRNA formyltransferase